ncbi:MAG: DUF1579 family protein [Verrucomicrobiota bacterium]
MKPTPIFMTLFLSFLPLTTHAQLASIPELEPLNRYAGTWTTTFTLEGKTPDTLTGTVTAEWILGGRYLQQTATIPNVGDTELSVTTLMTYDPENKVYRHWSFDSSGDHNTGTGTWDAEANTFSWNLTDPLTNATTRITSTLPTGGPEEWIIVNEDASGKATGMISGKNTLKTN